MKNLSEVVLGSNLHRAVAQIVRDICIDRINDVQHARAVLIRLVCLVDLDIICDFPFLKQMRDTAVDNKEMRSVPILRFLTQKLHYR